MSPSIAGSTRGQGHVTESHTESLQQGTSGAGSGGVPAGQRLLGVLPLPISCRNGVFFLLFFLPHLTTFGWFLGSNQITPPHPAPALSSELIIMPGYCLLTILRHRKLISPWLIFSRVTLIGNLLQSPHACPLPCLAGVRWPQPPRTTLSSAKDSEQRRWPGQQAGRAQPEGRLQWLEEICTAPKTSQRQARAGKADCGASGPLAHRAWSKSWWP